MSRKPDFIGLGAQKAATSWIHACLYEHPQVFLPAHKEIHFFSRHYTKGASWYEEHFRDCRPEQIAGEFSPSYLYDPDAPERIHEWNPAVKLIVCLRDPIDRAVSAYRYAVKMGTVSQDKSFDEAVREKPSYLEHSLYFRQLERYFQCFGPRQLLIMFYEEIPANPRSFVNQIYQFLGVDCGFEPSMALRRVNASLGAPRFISLDKLLRFASSSLRKVGLSDMVWRFARSPAGEALLKFNRRPPTSNTLSSARRAELETFFAADVARLEKLVSRDLGTIWLKQTR